MTTPEPHRDRTSADTDPVRWAFDRLRVDHTHKRYHHRIARALADRLPTLLEHDEKVLGFTEAIADSDFLTRASLGFGWPVWRRVALVFTDHRLLEVGLSACGRRARGRIHSFPWDGVPGVDSTSNRLEVSTWSKSTHRWRLRDPLAAGLARAVRQRVDLAVSTYQPSRGLSVPIRLCADCGAPVRVPRAACAGCGKRARSSRLAGILALAFPGAGSAYTGNGGAAVLRLAVEVAVFGWLALRILSASTPWQVIAPAAGWVIAILIIKLQGYALARRLAPRAELSSRSTERRWRWFAGLAGTLSLVAAFAPLALVGQTDRDISWDLDFIVSDGEWTESRSRTPTDPETLDDALRSQWLHDTGQQADVRAWPMRPFESVRAAEERYVANVDGEVETMDLGAHRAVASKVDEVGHSTLWYAIVDGEGRDVHVVSADVDSEDARRFAWALERLISHGVWVPAHPSGGAGRP